MLGLDGSGIWFIWWQVGTEACWADVGVQQPWDHQASENLAGGMAQTMW